MYREIQPDVTQRVRYETSNQKRRYKASSARDVFVCIYSRNINEKVFVLVINRNISVKGLVASWRLFKETFSHQCIKISTYRLS